MGRKIVIDREQIPDIKALADDLGVEYTSFFRLVKGERHTIRLSTMLSLIEHYGGGKLPAPFKVVED
jgi:hypothetical protein